MKISKLFTSLFVATVTFSSTTLAEGTEAGTKISNSPILKYREDRFLGTGEFYSVVFYTKIK